MNKKKEVIQDYLIWHYNNHINEAPDSASVEEYIKMLELITDPEEVQPWDFWNQNIA